MTETLAYFDGGDTYKGCRERTKGNIDTLKKEAKDAGHVGYLIGFRTFAGRRDRVYCFFKQQPTIDEIIRRRANGFFKARWYRL